MATLHKDLRTFMTSRYVLLTMSNVSDISCKENQNAHFMFKNLFWKSCCLQDVQIYMVQPNKQ